MSYHIFFKTITIVSFTDYKILKSLKKNLKNSKNIIFVQKCLFCNSLKLCIINIFIDGNNAVSLMLLYS